MVGDNLVDIEAFIARCDAVAAARKISRARLSILLLNDSEAIDRLAERGGLTVRSLNKAHKELSSLERDSAGQARSSE